MPHSTHDHCVSVNAPINVTNGMATVTVSDLQCGVTYTIIAEGTLNGTFVGPESSHGNITAGPCPVMTSKCICILV